MITTYVSEMRMVDEEIIQQKPTKTGNAITKTVMVTSNGLSKAKERTLIVGIVEGLEEGGVDVGIEVGYACRLTRKSKGVRVGVARATIASGVKRLYALYKTWEESKGLVSKTDRNPLYSGRKDTSGE